MTKSMKTILGVTLLEIMLVLAIAAMIIILSIRYYGAASYSSQANQLMSNFQAITAAAENLSQGSGTYSSVTSAQIITLTTTNAFTSPWGGTITYAGTAASITLSVANTPAGVCNILALKLAGDPHTSASTASSSCSGVVSFSYNYVPNPGTTTPATPTTP